MYQLEAFSMAVTDHNVAKVVPACMSIIALQISTHTTCTAKSLGIYTSCKQHCSKRQGIQLFFMLHPAELLVDKHSQHLH